ncbi:unnamed protein product [Hymenolepis diminuta]|uniref:RRM domain-containing protein n=1 Tax=Hymenolepis diminuta TaxID=6216 RepID=A0A564YJ49_HYMDI|nr:unnamed protein product [Hymenolepis diminuta]
MSSGSSMEDTEIDTNTKLFVGDIFPKADAQTLLHRFRSCGKVKSIEIRSSRDLIKNSFSNATVVYEKREDAIRALSDLNGAEVMGNPIRISWYQPDPKKRYIEGANVIIRNLDRNILQSQLYVTIEKAGHIVSCKIARDSNGNSLGYAYVSFESAKAADFFIKMLDGTIVGPKKISIVKHVRKSERPHLNEPHQFRNCYVKNFGPDVTDEGLKSVFKQFGTITSAVVMKDGNISKKFGFVCFENPSSAEAAVREMNGKLFNGRRLYVGRAMRRAERFRYLTETQRQIDSFKQSDKSTVFISHFEESVNEEMLKNHFARFGKIERVTIVRDRRGVFRGFGFIQFSSQSEAARALELCGKPLNSKPLYVALKQTKEEENLMKRQLSLQLQQSIITQNMPILFGPFPWLAQRTSTNYCIPRYLAPRGI